MPSPKLGAAVALVALIVSPGPAAWASPIGTAPARDGSQQPRDPRNDVPRPESAREQELNSAIATEPGGVANWLELAKLQEARGAIADAERTFKMAVDALGPNRPVLMAQASFFTRDGRFEKAIESLEAAADVDPTDPAGHQLVATYYWEKAFKDQAITPAEKVKYIDAGLAATDRALALRAAYAEAMTYRTSCCG
jgi:tetratricopeptide (TPR) repeat protein